MLHIVGALGPAIASGFYLKRNNIKFKHFLFTKKIVSFIQCFLNGQECLLRITG